MKKAYKEAVDEEDDKKERKTRAEARNRNLVTMINVKNVLARKAQVVSTNLSFVN